MSLQTSLSWFVVLWWGLGSAPVGAQPTPPPADAATPTVTRPLINSVQAEVAANAELSEEVKAQAGELAQQALSHLQAIETHKAEAQRSQDALEKLADEHRRIEQELASWEQASEPKMEAVGSVSDMEAERSASQQTIAEREKDLAQPSADPTARTARRRAARTFLLELPAELQEVEERLKTPPPEGEPPQLTKLRQYTLQARLDALKQRELAAQGELTLFDAEDALQLPTLRRELLTRQLTRERKLVEQYTARINQIRQAEAEKRVREAKQAAMQAEPSLMPIVKANEQIALEEADIRKKHEAVEKSIRELDQRLAELREDMQDVRELDEQVGLSASAGLQLRKRRSELPNLAIHQAERTERYEVLERAYFILYERTDQLDDLQDIAAAAEAVVRSSGVSDPQLRDQLREDATTALRAQHDYLDKVVNAYRHYTDALTRLDLLQEQLIKVTREFAAFVDERILWVRSHRPLGAAGVLADLESVTHVAGLDAWRSLARVLSDDLRANPLLYTAVGALVVFLLVLRWNVGRRLKELAKRAENRVGVSLLPTVQAAQYTVLAAVTWPGLMWFLAWRLAEVPEPPRIALAAGVSLTRLAALYFLLELLRQSLRPNGLCESHFGWPWSLTRRTRQRVKQLMFLGLPIAAMLALMHFHAEDGGQAEIERLLFMAAMLVLVRFVHGLLHPTHGALRELLNRPDGGWIERLGVVWYFLGLGLPVLLGVFAATGYYYAAQELVLRSQVTLWLLLMLIYAREFALRWLMLHHRRLRLQQLRERQTSQPAAAVDETGAPLPEPEPDEADLASISRQSQRLISTTFIVACMAGTWMIWADVFPALRFLERWPLWSYQTQVMEEVEEDGVTVWKPRDVIVPVTITDLALAVLMVVLTWTAARNLPGFLEITLLQKLPIDRSTSYAITALVRYALALIGIVLAAQTLGIGWSKVQWLAAALTFGLGFGLQEIFANFVSGIIILFEQPVRVGDIITIDGVSGAVNRIRIRATTIVDWDRKEYIVPNREFITGRLLNWTLSDKTNRLVVNVRVAYGTDPDLARRTILEAAQAQEALLDDPAPLVTLEEFGENSLNFVLRAYLPNLDNRLQTIHDLHCDINARFKAAGIRIPFPQRELHLRTTPEFATDGRGTALAR